MARRFFAFGLGIATGSAATIYAQRRYRKTVQRYAPPAIAERMTDAVKRFGSDVAASAREGRSVMLEREQTLRTRQHRTAARSNPSSRAKSLDLTSF